MCQLPFVRSPLAMFRNVRHSLTRTERGAVSGQVTTTALLALAKRLAIGCLVRRRLTREERVEASARVLGASRCRDGVTIRHLADLHIGSPNCDIELVKSLVAENVANHWYAFLVGDLLDVELKNSKSDVYTQTMTIDEAMDTCCDILTPLADAGLILGAVQGNHNCGFRDGLAGLRAATARNPQWVLGRALDRDGLHLNYIKYLIYVTTCRFGPIPRDSCRVQHQLLRSSGQKG